MIVYRVIHHYFAFQEAPSAPSYIYEHLDGVSEYNVKYDGHLLDFEWKDHHRDDIGLWRKYMVEDLYISDHISNDRGSFEE